ncbi:hypothetical protein F8388_021279 [Cannabis sativa]|uniref:Uncharacterized protein n=1 Tax=Cannabis sativa TaxID=3483 RepID=A0A7J6GFA5_CANSA|nr:hypothetical protein F8388_021279 [Cannabis sativa]
MNRISTLLRSNLRTQMEKLEILLSHLTFLPVLFTLLHDAKKKNIGENGKKKMSQDTIAMIFASCESQTFKLGSCTKYAVASRLLQDHILQVSSFARHYSTDASVQKEDSATDLKSGIEGFKGHDMLAPFTAGWQSSDVHPLIIEKSEGSYVYDSNGKKYLDALAGLWCTALGGNEPRLVAAATKQLNTLPFYHSFWNRTTKPSLDLAKELLETFTASKMAKAFFTNSGSEANDTQVPRFNIDIC